MRDNTTAHTSYHRDLPVDPLVISSEQALHTHTLQTFPSLVTHESHNNHDMQGDPRAGEHGALTARRSPYFLGHPFSSRSTVRGSERFLRELWHESGSSSVSAFTRRAKHSGARHHSSGLLHPNRTPPRNLSVHVSNRAPCHHSARGRQQFMALCCIISTTPVYARELGRLATRCVG